ncbi:hypothetical protein [Maribacter polysiphoniae]|uniref:hypothetical protein n=1 Tax=Maribacter polysiphoniae TaxID=429344 RepID=UPI002357A6F4|nr:hypothetical protein [Maribacter polysiphoniae]
MDFIKENWNWIVENIWKVVSLVLISFITGWRLASLFYNERIEILKAKKNTTNSIISPDEFKYPETGRNGKNILANSTLTINKNEKVSLKAIIPNNEKLVVELKGPRRVHKQDDDASWVFSLGRIRNWTAKTYEPENGGRQEFDAETGTADMELEFKREGEIIISVFEGERRSNTWTKRIKVRN